LWNDTSICINAVFPLLNAGFGNASSYQWFYDGNPIGNNNQTLQTSAPGSYVVTVVSLTGCTGTDSIQIGISDPQVELGPNITVCSNAAYPNLNAGNQGADFAWSQNGNPVGGNTQTYQPVAPGLYSVTVTNQFGCTATDNMTISTAPAPTSSFTIPPTATTGTPILPVNNSTPPPLTYIWNFGDNTPNSTLAAPPHTYLTAGPRTVFLIVSTGICSDTSVQNINVLWDCPSLGLTASFTNNDTVFMDLSGLAIFSSNSQNATDYIWNFGDGNTVTGETDPTHVYTSSGSYTITLTTINYNCTTSTTGSIVVIEKHDAGIENYGNPGNIVVYPNPTEGIVTIDLRSLPGSSGIIPVLYTSAGQIVPVQNSNFASGVYTADLQSRAPGLYFVKIFDGHRQYVVRVIKN
jgi:PKD repeat protein